MANFADEHPRIVHYTNFAGLTGIVGSQQLWASHILYLNDEAEFTAYLENRFPTIVSEVLRGEYAGLQDKSEIEAQGGLEKIIAERVSALGNAVRETTVKLNDPFVTSFSLPNGSKEDDEGLLSQWQCYGQDGGFAIEFDSGGLLKLLEEDAKIYATTQGVIGTAEYYTELANHTPQDGDLLEREHKIRTAIRNSLQSDDSSVYEPMFEPVLSLASLHKHYGFSPEKEARIVTILSGLDTPPEFRAENEKSKRKVYFREGASIPIPFLKLFEREKGHTARLPITRIIVGPHKERRLRQHAVRLLLDSASINAPVSTSSIPYVGRR